MIVATPLLNERYLEIIHSFGSRQARKRCRFQKFCRSGTHSPCYIHSPEILSARELAAQRAANGDFKMYDAILENPSAQDEIDPALEKLLQDYLNRMWPRLIS